jgi:uncharacterized protein (DUF302 family)
LADGATRLLAMGGWIFGPTRDGNTEAHAMNKIRICACLLASLVFFSSGAPASSEDNQAKQASQTLEITHVKIVLKGDFEKAHHYLLNYFLPYDPNLSKILAEGNAAKVAAARNKQSKLYLFLTRDHGRLVTVDRQKAKAIQFEVGSQIVAETMTRHQIAAALYAPLRFVLYEDAHGKAVIEYDLPSSLFAQYGDPNVTAVGKELDAKLGDAFRELEN